MRKTIQLTLAVFSLLPIVGYLSNLAAQEIEFEISADSVDFEEEGTENEFEEEEEDELESDRDSFTRSPRLMAPCRTMVEASYMFLEQSPAQNGHVYPDLLVRYGLSEIIELRLGWNYESAKFQHLAHAGAPPVEEGILNYGAKFCVTKDCPGLPDSALIVTGYTPTSGHSNDSDFSLEYAFGWKACEWELDGMIRWFTLAEEQDRFTEWAPSVVLKRHVLCGRGNVHVEYFSLHSQNRENNYQQRYFGPGGHYLLTPDFEIGARVFWGLSDDAADFVCQTGFAVRY